MNELQRRAAALLAQGATQPEAGKAIGRRPRTLRDWYRDVPGFREAARPAEKTREEDLIELTPHAVLEHLLRDPRPEIRLRAADILSKNAPGGPVAEPSYISFGATLCASGKPCECADCRARTEAALEDSRIAHSLNLTDVGFDRLRDGTLSPP
jgi:hypothetical protein